VYKLSHTYTHAHSLTLALTHNICFQSKAAGIKNHPWFKGFDWNALLNMTMVAPQEISNDEVDKLTNFSKVSKCG
jgi:hypothetical protein